MTILNINGSGEMRSCMMRHIRVRPKRRFNSKLSVKDRASTILC